MCPSREPMGQRVTVGEKGMGLARKVSVIMWHLIKALEGRMGQEPAMRRADGSVFWTGKCSGEGENQLGFP